MRPAGGIRPRPFSCSPAHAYGGATPALPSGHGSGFGATVSDGIGMSADMGMAAAKGRR